MSDEAEKKTWYDADIPMEIKAISYDKITRAFFASINMSRTKRLVYIFKAVKQHLPIEAQNRWKRKLEKKIKRLEMLQARGNQQTSEIEPLQEA